MKDENFMRKLKKLRLDDRAFIAVLLVLYTNEYADVQEVKLFINEIFERERDLSCYNTFGIKYLCKKFEQKKCSTNEDEGIAIETFN